ANDFTESTRTTNSNELSTRATLTGNAPPWAKSSNFKAPASNADWVGVRVYLDWQNPDEAASLAAAVSDPSSAQYGQFLTPQQFRQRFAPAQASVQAVQQWLTSQGFNVVYTPQNNLYVSAEGTVAQASAALGVSFATYAYTPDQVKGGYGISGYDGSGQTVAIIDAYASPTIQQDLDQWSANRGLPSTKITQVVAPGTYHHPEAGLKQDPQGWYGEE